ncbi:putative SNF2 family helicase [Aspergillus neoniger CBS 115656]|uniref:SNF2 family helicase n=1 Tax=Aspergillus neoniger (strain CBS 115656) TaxID=1448310 RepID=A0A318ZT17_ASPNB|nr:SNF2 family helicase [Aspergillus neoniger CBS 115656]PYH38842.1 SNF2 family helicase [Aspergillus neoniger CBS 115656]
MEGSSEELEPPKITQEAAAGSEDVQEPDKQGSSLQSESFDPQQILLDAIDRRRQQCNPRQAFFLSNLGFDIHNPVRHTGISPSEFLSVPNDQVTAAQTGFDESLFVPQEEYSSLYLPPSGPDVPPMSPDDQNMLELLQGLNPEGDTSPPVQQLSQNLPYSSASASQTGNAGTTAAPADDEKVSRLSALSCVHSISSSSSTSGDTDVPVEDFPDDTGDQSCPAEWPDEELETSTRADLSKRQFNSIKKWFDKIDEPDEPTSRQVPIEKRTESSHDVPVKRQPKQRRQNRISADEKRKSKELGLAAVLAQQKKRGPSTRAPRKRKERGLDNAIPGPSKKAKRGTLGSKKYLEALLSSTIVADAHANASLDAIPELKNKDKMKALTQLVASLPSADQQEAKTDKKSIIIATRKFTNIPRSDGKSGWRLKGMNTSLYHYQVLGAAFMRDRESRSQRPFGGLLCDIMGFGKTIQALANIIDGKPSDPDDPIKTTLIIVPSHLVTHWKTQINLHCEKKAIGNVLIYKASSRLETLDTNDTVESLARYDVIITTYDEVRRSYPRTKIVESVEGEEKLAAWWDQSYEEQTGPLHRMKYHRIIIDEGHAIKNHLSSVSIAVRSLTSHFKWILSGTPVHNYLEEFYPLFHFLGVPGIKDVGSFIKNFCSDDDGHDRLVNILRAFLFRRTHKSRLFALPVIKLPDVNERIVRVAFCAVERELYNAISEVFIENINGCAQLEQPKLVQYRCFLSMILMLLKLLVSVRRNTTVLNERENEDTSQYSTELRGDKTALTESFRQLMDELHDREMWDERLQRTNCPECEFVPVKPVITSCKHLYCEECYYSLRMDKDKMIMEPECVRCRVPIMEAAYFEEAVGEKTQPASVLESLKGKEKQSKKKTTTKKKGTGNMGRFTTPLSEEMDEEPDADEDTDWIEACARNMPSAKLTKIREVLTEWLAQESPGKIVIFTQFLDFVKILSTMCEAEGWPFVLLTGKLSLSVRENNMKTFSDKNSEVRILIASLKAGGIGLDLSAANKCILVDLWWNEAIQEQAFCRLFRIGQESEVEFVKLIVDNSIDDYLLDLQTHKTAVITGAMGDGVLVGRDTIEDLLRMFADVEKDSRGVLHLRAKTASRDIRIGAGFPPTFGVF